MLIIVTRDSTFAITNYECYVQCGVLYDTLIANTPLSHQQLSNDLFNCYISVYGRFSFNIHFSYFVWQGRVTEYIPT